MFDFFFFFASAPLFHHLDNQPVPSWQFFPCGAQKSPTNLKKKRKRMSNPNPSEGGDEGSFPAVLVRRYCEDDVPGACLGGSDFTYRC
jgi:hypothetical protein